MVRVFDAPRKDVLAQTAFVSTYFFRIASTLSGPPPAVAK